MTSSRAICWCRVAAPVSRPSRQPIRGTSDQASVESAARCPPRRARCLRNADAQTARLRASAATTLRIGDAESSSNSMSLARWIAWISLRFTERAAARFLPLRGHGGVGRAASVRTTSITALKDFLRGEQLVRRALYDSATYYFQRASELDTTFALAFQRRYSVRLHQGDGESAEDFALALRAGRLNHSLAPRDSLMVAVDSMQAAIALRDYAMDSLGLALRRRVFRALDSAAVRFPADADIWFRMGFARNLLQQGEFTPDDVLEPFDRSIELDSTFLPPYRLRSSSPWLRRGSTKGDAYRGLPATESPPTRTSDGMRLALRLINAQGRSARETQLDCTGTGGRCVCSVAAVFGWPDSAETSIRVARRIAEDPCAVRNLLQPMTWVRNRLSVIQSARSVGDVVVTWGSAEALLKARRPRAQCRGAWRDSPAEVDRLSLRRFPHHRASRDQGHDPPTGVSAATPRLCARELGSARRTLDARDSHLRDHLRYLAEGAGRIWRSCQEHGSSDHRLLLPEQDICSPATSTV